MVGLLCKSNEIQCLQQFLPIDKTMEVRIYNALEMFQKENSLPCIPTFSQSLDKLLGNGVQLGVLTELLGLSGTGKTQLCLQLCASVQIPAALGGLNAEAIYVDTNTNFTIERFKDILSESISRCQSLLGLSLSIDQTEALKKLHYVNACGLPSFCSFIQRLPKLLQERPNVRLITIDSITFPFKGTMDVRKRTGWLFQKMADLQKLAVEKQIAIVLSNEMSTRARVPGATALGDAWAHRCNVRVLLCAPQLAGGDALAHRHALALKGAGPRGQVAHFQITHEGIRDIE